MANADTDQPGYYIPHSGWYPVNLIHIGTLQDLNILPYIRREAFEISALSLCKKDIKDEC